MRQQKIGKFRSKSGAEIYAEIRSCINTYGWGVLGNTNNEWLVCKTEDGKLIDKSRKK